MVTKHGKTYRVSLYCDETVPPFGPTLPDPPEFEVCENNKTKKKLLKYLSQQV